MWNLESFFSVDFPHCNVMVLYVDRILLTFTAISSQDQLCNSPLTCLGLLGRNGSRENPISDGRSTDMWHWKQRRSIQPGVECSLAIVKCNNTDGSDAKGRTVGDADAEVFRTYKYILWTWKRQNLALDFKLKHTQKLGFKEATI